MKPLMILVASLLLLDSIYAQDIQTVTLPWISIDIPIEWKSEEEVINQGNHRSHKLVVSSTDPFIVIDISRWYPPIELPKWEYGRQMLALVSGMDQNGSYSSREAPVVMRSIGSERELAHRMDVTLRRGDQKSIDVWEVFKITDDGSETYFLVSYSHENATQSIEALEGVLKTVKLTDFEQDGSGNPDKPDSRP